MLTADEEKFIEYWKDNRMRQKRFVKQLMIGLPLSVVFVIAIFVNFLSGWYKRAEMIFNTQSSLIPVLLIAAIAIVIFTSIFTVRHRWDINEQRYKELTAKRENFKTGAAH